MWNKRSGKFDTDWLQDELMLRNLDRTEFAAAIGVSRTTIYEVLGGKGVVMKTAMRILRGLARIPPKSPYED